MGGFPFELEADFLEEGVGLGGVLGFALGDEALDDGGAGFAFAGLEVFPGDPFGGEAGVMGGELRVEVGFGGGEVLEAVGGFAFAVVGDGVEEAEAGGAGGLALGEGLVDPIDELAEIERGAWGQAGEGEGAVVFVDDGVAKEAGGGAAGAEAEDVAGGGIEDDAGDLGLAGAVIGEVFAAEEGGVDAAEGAAVGLGEDVAGEAGLDLFEVAGGVEIADEAAAVFALYVAEGGVEDGGVVPVGGGAEGVVDAPEALGGEGGGGFGVVAHGGDPFDAP